jgi:hypothetical protein
VGVKPLPHHFCWHLFDLLPISVHSTGAESQLAAVWFDFEAFGHVHLLHPAWPRPRRSQLWWQLLACDYRCVKARVDGNSVPVSSCGYSVEMKARPFSPLPRPFLAPSSTPHCTAPGYVLVLKGAIFVIVTMLALFSQLMGSRCNPFRIGLITGANTLGERVARHTPTSLEQAGRTGHLALYRHLFTALCFSATALGLGTGSLIGGHFVSVYGNYFPLFSWASGGILAVLLVAVKFRRLHVASGR